MNQNDYQKTSPKLFKVKQSGYRLLLLMFLFVFLSSLSYGQGTWHPVASLSPYSSGGLMLLLSDGTVMAKTNAGVGYGNIWTKLTPDIHGSYINGTWSTLASMTDDRLYFSSQILKDGHVYVAGGEYGSGRTTSEIYDPVSNTWMTLPNTGRTFSDANSEILPDGKVLQALVDGYLNGTLIYDPVTNQYTNGPSANGITNESAWVKLKDNSVLMVDRDTRNSERYIPSLNQWITDATLPVSLYDIYGSETGSAFLLPDGRAFFIGASGNTAYYTPSGNNNPGSWTAGPVIPNGYGAPDAAAAMMVNGKILCVLSPPPTSEDHFPAPSYFYEFNYLTNSFTQISSPTGASSENYPSFISNMLCLPDGTILYSTQGNSQYYVYVPDGTPLAAGKPAINQVSKNDCSGSAYTITGTLFNGISEGASYGDDWQMATNYPIVRLTNGSNVYYARTYNWDNTGVQTGSTITTTQFKLPDGLPDATYSLVVTANGISSDPISFTPSSTCTTVSITSPANNSVFTAPANIIITASASRNGGSITKVDFYNGSNLIGTATTAPYSIVWNNVAEGTYSLTAKATDDQGGVTISSAVTVYVTSSSPNLALNKYALSSSNEADWALASNAVDGNMTTRWSSAFSDPQWIYVDLGATYNINRVKINWENAYGKDYQIQVSSDAVNWTDIKTVTGNTTLVNDWTGLNGSGRYVRIYGTARGTGYGYSIYELEVYGTNQPPVVSITSPANNASFNATDNINITASASDIDGTVSKVDFYSGSNLIGTSTTAPYSITWNNVAAGTYTLTAKATDNLGNVGISPAITINVSSVSPNLALNKYALSSSNESDGLLASNAVDGNMGTRWSSAFSDPQWIYVDLGTNYSINRVKITWETAYGKDYKIQTSTDAINWTDIKTVTGNTTLVNDWTSLSGSGRYVRIYGTARGTGYGYSIYELEVYGGPEAAKVAAEDNSQSASVSFVTYPNPANEELNIALDCESEEQLTIVMTELMSREGVSFQNHVSKGYNLIKLNAVNLSAGTYVLQVIGTNQKFITRVVIVH